MKKQYSFLLLYFLLNLAITLVFTYPLIKDLSNNVFGFSGDNFSSIWYFWWLKFADAHNLTRNWTNLVGYPFGQEFTNATSIVEIFWNWPMEVITKLFNEVLAFNTLILLSFPISAVSMYFFTNYLFKNKWVASFCGIAYAFLPYHFWQGYAHISLALIYCIPLSLLSLFYFNDKRTYKSAILLGLSLFVTTMTTFYYGYFIFLTIALYFFWKIVYSLATKRDWYLNLDLIKKLLLSVLIFVVLMSPFLYIFFSSISEAKQNNEVSIVPERSINDLLSLSIRPWDLVIPAPNHFLFGEPGQIFYINKIITLTQDFKSRSAFLPERVNYTGILVITLSLIGIVYGIRKKETRELTAVLTLLFISLYIVASPAFVIIKGITIHLPSYYLYQYVTFIRAYVRLGIIISLIIILLSGFILKKFFSSKNIYLNIVIFALITGVTLFEFAPRLDSSSTNLSDVTGAYKWLSENTKDVSIVEYPKDFDIPDALMMQRTHAKPIMNPIHLYRQMIFDGIEDPFAPQSLPILGSLGIDYIVVHTKPLYVNKHPIDELSYTRFGQEWPARSPRKLVYEDRGVYVFPVPKNDRDLGGGIVLFDQGFQWVGSNKKLFTKGEGFVYLGNFTKNNLEVDFEIKGPFEKGSFQISGESKPMITSSRKLVLKKGWTTLSVRVKENQEFQFEITNPTIKPN